MDEAETEMKYDSEEMDDVEEKKQMNDQGNDAAEDPLAAAGLEDCDADDDVSNDLFELFLDDTMTYSSAIFKTEDEDLKFAQLRKISLLIEKARIKSHHEILEIGSGWGSLAIKVVKQTGCKYTGITLSEEQLKYAESRVKEAGLQDRIRFLLCDYRQLAKSHKFDRIISCEMMEAIGHEYMEEFFSCCDSVLAENGLFVVQFISMPDERYEEHR